MHKHLTWTDRLKIEKGLKEGLKPCAIADRLHVHNTTIYRELKRGRYTHLNSDLTTEERYSPEIAQQRYEENLKAKGGELKIGNDYELSAFIEKKIGEEGYSPAAVVGEIKRLGLTFKTEMGRQIHHLDIKISFTTHFFGKIQYIGIKYSSTATYSVSMFLGAKNRPSIRKLMT